MAAASVYVLPSVREPYPMSVLEAMSVGLPVVVSADCGLAPLVERARCGIVTDRGDASVCSCRQIHPRRTDFSLGRWASGRGKRRVANFGMGAIGDRLMTVYNEFRNGASNESDRRAANNSGGRLLY